MFEENQLVKRNRASDIEYPQKDEHICSDSDEELCPSKKPRLDGRLSRSPDGVPVVETVDQALEEITSFSWAIYRSMDNFIGIICLLPIVLRVPDMLCSGKTEGPWEY